MYLFFSPGTLESAPHSIISAVYASSTKAEEEIQKAVTDAFPNVSAIGVKDALENANKILNAISAAIRITASITLIAGILVLVGAFSAQHQKTRLRCNDLQSPWSNKKTNFICLHNGIRPPWSVVSRNIDNVGIIDKLGDCYENHEN